MEKELVINLGGSALIEAGKIKTQLIKNFANLIKKEVRKKKRFIIVVGGGETARIYQKAGEKLGAKSYHQDWLGILATKLNAYLLKIALGKIAEEKFFEKRFAFKKFGSKKVILATGWEPGWSTDFVALQIASDFKIKKVIILGKPDYVYTKDFTKFKSAQPLKDLTWKEYLKLIPKKWTPGLKVPVDPVGARLAKKENIKVIVAKAGDLKNLKNILECKKFKGTLIHN